MRDGLNAAAWMLSAADRRGGQAGQPSLAHGRRAITACRDASVIRPRSQRPTYSVLRKSRLGGTSG